MISPDDLAEQIRSTGFSCTGCGNCCRCSDADPGHVMVTCDEIRAIMALTGLSWGAVAAPYPESIPAGNGSRYTLGWCLQRDGDACRFLADGRCSIYASRPWICRTYPFMLDHDRLAVSECNGVGLQIAPGVARQTARDLILRQKAEIEDELQIRHILRKNLIPGGSFVVVDSEGMKVIDG